MQCEKEPSRISIGKTGKRKKEAVIRSRNRTPDGEIEGREGEAVAVARWCTHPYEYSSWKAMMGRCFYTTHEAHDRYEGRGILPCARMRDFSWFVAEMGERLKGLTLDRIRNNLGYNCGKCKECVREFRCANCRWATYTQQMRNRRGNVLVDFKGNKVTVAELSEHIGIDRKTLEKRISKYKITGEKLLQESCQRKGEDSPAAKLTWGIVNAARADYATGKYTQAQIRRMHGIGKSNVGYILSGKAWK